MNMLKSLLIVIATLFSPFICYIIYFYTFTIVQYCYYRFYEKYPIKKLEAGYEIKEERDSVFKRLFIQLPVRFVKDLLNRDPYEFREYGLHLFTGMQGAGKTISMVEWIMRCQRIYPKCKVYTNFSYSFEDGAIEKWQDLINLTNEHYGVIKAIDEVQTWFSSKESGNMPYEMLGEVCQQRKQRSTICMTAQCYNRVIKEIREQITFVYVPRTILGCLTIVRRTRPDFWDDEKQQFTQFERTYFFVHTDELRNAYDTYKKIVRSADAGFKKRERIETNSR